MALRSAQQSRNPAQIRSPHRASPSSCTAAWPRCEARLDHFVREGTRQYRASRGPTESRRPASRRGAAREAASSRKHVPKMKDPSGGTTGRVKLYGRLGWMGARAEYSRWGGITAPTSISRSTLIERSKRRPIFLILARGDCRKITAQQPISRRLRPICPTPSTAGSRSVPGSRKRYRRTDRAPAFFLHRACRKPRQAAPTARRSPR